MMSSKENNNEPLLREAQIEDYLQVQALQEKAGLEADSLEDWKRIWLENPSRDEKIPMGWVLDVNSTVVGFLGNVPLSYNLGGKFLKAAAARGWVVDPPYRSHTLELLLKYLNQRNVDILLNSSSNEPAFRIFSNFGCQILPLDVYGQVLFWILRGKAFFEAAFKKLGIKGMLSKYLSLILGSLFTIRQLFDKIFLDKRLAYLRDGHEFKIFRPGEIKDDFDKLWFLNVNKKRRFLANRQSKMLNWHYAHKENCVKIIGCYKQDALRGYITIMKNVKKTLGSVRYKVIDLFTLFDDETVVKLLFIKAHQIARDDGVDSLEIVGFPENIRSQARRLGAMARKSFPTPFTYKIVNQELSRAEFSKEDLWYTCLYDGDSSL